MPTELARRRFWLLGSGVGIDRCVSADETAREHRDGRRLAQPAREPAPPIDRAPPPRTWSQDPAGGALVGSGLALVAVGTGLYGGSHALARDRMETEAQYERRRSSVRGLSVGGITLLAVGGALVVGGIVRWVIVARRGGRATAWRGDVIVWRF